MNPTFLALDSLLTRYVNLFHATEKKLPSVKFDSTWPSPCQVEADQSGLVYWRPHERNQIQLFAGLEKSLEFSFHNDIKQFYGSFWSNGVSVEREDINFNLIQIWNEEDEQQLLENMLGHIFAKIKAKLPISFFIGCGFGEDVICLEQETGQIVIEQPGKKVQKVLAPNLESFLISLTPTSDPYSP